MSHPGQGEPALKFSGMVPRYVRERHAAAVARLRAEADAAERLANLPGPDTAELMRAMRPVDAATSDLRRRLAAAPHDTLLRRPLAAVTLVLAVLAGSLVSAMRP